MAALNEATLLDYLPKGAVVLLNDLSQLEDSYAQLINKKRFGYQNVDDFLESCKCFKNLLFCEQALDSLSPVTLLDKSAGFYSEQNFFSLVSFEILNRLWRSQFCKFLFESPAKILEIADDELDLQFFLNIPASLRSVAEIHFYCANETEVKQLKEAFEGSGLKVFYKLSYLGSSFYLPLSQKLFISLPELTKRYKVYRPKQRSHFHFASSDSFELNVGDLVVHLNQGIAKYLGMEKKVNHLGNQAEFLSLEFADGAKLFVPISQAHLVTKYISADQGGAPISALGSKKWLQVKQKTEHSIAGYAKQLLEIHAKRALRPADVYPADSAEMKAFEAEFPFIESEDQLLAISAIKDDMRANKVMDRLVCGDVGYGKTEVAMRAAFKTVVDGGKQVAVLVPTTVLAMQHYENFVERVQNFPVTVEVLSRFKSSKQTKSALEGVKNGSVDIVIGTHRLISKDVEFKNLGLIIIDEEQRFGVKAKEYLKSVKENVNCLTLSATPIPRTLYMSLVGAREMSVINTPPQDRLPIKTMVTDSSDKLVKEAILRELGREGQVFFIHNRVETIYGIKERLLKLLPQAKIAVVHGQMGAKEIDAAFHLFKSGGIDILVATTIVENGIDIANANTILIDQADKFGLATLYQLRGRVGRWNRRAFAYFMVPNLNRMSEISRKRLAALAQSSGYGAGMKLAMHDLEIRGAGDILGVEQSGHISAVGFHLYCKLLRKTVDQLKGISIKFEEAKLELLVDARLTEQYIPEISMRLDIYHRLGEATKLEMVDDIWQEIIDRFGKPPEPALYLYHLSRIKVFASINGFTLIKQQKFTVTLERKAGKKESSHKFILPKFKTAAELERALVAEMQKIIQQDARLVSR